MTKRPSRRARDWARRVADRIVQLPERLQWEQGHEFVPCSESHNSPHCLVVGCHNKHLSGSPIGWEYCGQPRAAHAQSAESQP